MVDRQRAFPNELIEIVAPNVIRMTVATEDWQYQTPNFYLYTNGGEGVVIDSGCGTTDEFGAFREAWNLSGKPKINAIILTHNHFDHKDGSSEFADLIGAEIIGGDEQEQTPQELSVGKEVLLIKPTPGHTKDSVIIANPKSNELFTGDTIVEDPSSVVEDMTDYSTSLREIKKLSPDVIFPGHGRTIYDPGEHIQNYIKRVQRRERHVIRYMRRGANTASQIARNVYPQGVGGLELMQINAHLQKLVLEGKAQLIEEKFTLT